MAQSGLFVFWYAVKKLLTGTLFFLFYLCCKSLHW